MFDLVSLIKTIGYLGVFGIIFAESGLFVGFFLPGDSLLFTAGFLASQGFLNIWYLIFFTAIGAIIGNNFGYAFGKKIGPMIFKKEDSFLFHKDHLRKAELFYGKYGGKAVVLARFMPGIRTFAPILAGVGKMDYKKFIIFNAIGCILWAIGLPLSGYFLGNTIPNVDKYIVPIILIIVILSVLPIFFNFLNDKTIRKKIFNFLGIKSKYPNKLICFNWKMNPETEGEAIRIAKESNYENVVVFPPFVFLEEVKKVLNHAKLGAQDIFYKDASRGAYTGEISAKELVNIGAEYVIIGHSERRAMGETEYEIANKLKIALENDLVPILCIGENLDQKNKGLTNKILRQQIFSALSLLTNIKNKIIIAYEPVWAIGTGEPESPFNAVETIKFIKKITTPEWKVLYGGSVNPNNIKEFLNYQEIDGVLVGSAGLNPRSFF